MNYKNITNGATIIIDGSDTKYHTYNDWNLVITNTDCIGEPIQDVKYVEVPGSNKKIDLSEVLTGYPTYLSRQIKIVLAGIRKHKSWDSVISQIRNKIHGRKCRIIFDNDPNWYYVGRISVTDFSSLMSRGEFTINISEADPFKYSMVDSLQKWTWDDFNFESGIAFPCYEHIDVSTAGEVTIEKGANAVTPEIIVEELSSGDTEVWFPTEDGYNKYPLNLGTNYIPQIKVNGEKDIRLIFHGIKTVSIKFTFESL